MKIQTINSTSFQAKKFRLPVKFVKPNTNQVYFGDRYTSQENLVSGNFVREYSNPKAEKYFNKAMETDNLDKKLKYLDKMGDYKIVDISLEQQLDSFVKADMP